MRYILALPQVPDPVKHISTSFDAALYGLKNDVLMMSSLTDRIFQTAFEALLTRNCELCDYVIADDEEIDILEKQVDQGGVILLIRFHPMATDMREVVSAMKVSTNLERIGDQSVTIARRAKRLNDRPLVPEVSLLEPLFQKTIAIFRDAIRAFADSDFELARTLKSQDKELDALTTDLGERLVVRATQNPESVPSYLDLIFVSRALERVGDQRLILLRIRSGATRQRISAMRTKRQKTNKLHNFGLLKSPLVRRFNRVAFLYSSVTVS